MNPKNSVKRVCEEILSSCEGFRGREEELFKLVEKMASVRPKETVRSEFVIRLRKRLEKEACDLEATVEPIVKTSAPNGFGLSGWLRFVFVPTAASAFAAFAVWNAFPGVMVPFGKIPENGHREIQAVSSGEISRDALEMPEISERNGERPSDKEVPSEKKRETPRIPGTEKVGSAVWDSAVPESSPSQNPVPMPAESVSMAKRLPPSVSDSFENAGTSGVSSFSIRSPSTDSEHSYVFTGSFPVMRETLLGYRLWKNGEREEIWEYPIQTDKDAILSLARAAFAENALPTTESETPFVVKELSLSEVSDSADRRFMVPSLVFETLANESAGTAKIRISVIIADLRRGNAVIPSASEKAGTSSGTVR